jgi:superfamily II DNA or RNA helicase
MGAIILTVNNNKTKIECSTKTLIKLRDHPSFCILAAGRFYAETFKKRIWDGYIRYITERGLMDTGKLPQLIKVLEGEFNKKVKIIDERDSVKFIGIPKKLGNLTPRPYQIDSIKPIVSNKLKGLDFPRGVSAAATNAGKTLMSAMIHSSYDAKTILLLSSKTLFDQAMKEIPELLPGKVGWIHAKEIVWNDFMIVMVATAKNRLPQIQHILPKYKILIVDECELSTSKTYQSVLNYMHNSFIKIGLSGSAFLNKDKNKNERVRCLYGDELYNITNRELMDLGFSSEVRVFIWQGNTKIKLPGNYVEEYEQGIIYSKERNLRIVNRTRFHVSKNRLPLLIMVKRHGHVEELYRLLMSKNLDPNSELFGLTIDWVHHKRKERDIIVEDFASGELDILVGSYILKRGINLKKMKALINAGGGDSTENTLQILGRATRDDEDKKYTIMDDFMDKGKYLMRHSKHRLITYKNEKLRVVEKFDKKLLR